MAGNAAAPTGELSRPPEESTTLPSDPGAGSSASPNGTTAESATDAVEPDDEDKGNVEDIESASKPKSSQRMALVLGLVVVLALSGLVGWLSCRTYQSRQANAQRELFLQVGRQGAINLTTIDFSHANSDIQRILDSATGTFHDDFSQRSQPFVDVVKQAKSISVGTVTAVGLESESDGQAQVLVAASVKTSTAGAADQKPHAWRMRISVQKVGDQTKVSNVEFVR
jgi:Mce-associated membrane protein